MDVLASREQHGTVCKKTISFTTPVSQFYSQAVRALHFFQNYFSTYFDLIVGVLPCMRKIILTV